MKNESVIEHSCTQEIWNKIIFQIFEGRKNEKENLFYVQNFILSNIIRHILDYRRFLFFPWYLRCRLLKMNMYCKRYVERTLLLVVVLFSLELLKFPSSIAIILYLVLKTEKRNKFQSLADSKKTKINGFSLQTAYHELPIFV